MFIGYSIFVIIYFMPTLLAVKYKKANLKLIFIINFIFGLTLIGWLVSLFLACRYGGERKRKIKVII